MDKNSKIQDLPGEEWKDVPNYKGLYQASNMGRIKSLPRKFQPKEKLMGCKLPTDYYIVNFKENGKNKQYFIHRVIAETFLPNAQNFPMVHHKDHNPSNNKLGNLMWASARQNSQFARKAKKFNIINKKKKTKKIQKIETPSFYFDKKTELKDEIWKEIKGYETYYEISNYGRVRALERICFRQTYYVKNKSKFLKPHAYKSSTSNGYLSITLCKENKLKTFLVHRLVALHFIENQNNYPHVNHKDFNKLNNHISNLEWVTHQQNIDHCIKNGHTDYKGEKNRFARFTEKEILEIRKLRKEGFSIRKLGKLFNTHPSVISNISNRKTWKHLP